MSRRSIGIVGARGIANYGGFETFVSELAPRLVARGFDVYCSCERDEKLNEEYMGAHLVYFPIEMPLKYQFRKILEIFYYIYFGILFTFKCDIVYFLGFGANIFTLFPRLFGKISLVNMAGVEWERSKFNSVERSLLKFLFLLSAIGVNYIVIDNSKLKDYIGERYRKKSVYISYGIDEISSINWNEKISEQYTFEDIKPNCYWLVVARLQPDNNIEMVLKAFMESESKKPLIIIGGYSAGDDYQKKIQNIILNKKDKKIILTGGIYDQEHLNMFRQNCFGYIHAHSIGGTNPSLLEAMIMKNIILAHDNKFNREVAETTAIYFNDIHDLKDKIKSVEMNYNNYAKLKIEAFNHVKQKYSWNKIVDEYDSLFEG